jgi:thiol-disulfide isomerase/thioredoxin
MKKLVKLFIIIFLLSGFQSSAQSVAKWKIGELENYIKQSAKPVIVNFWATFCKPCVEEIPYFQKLVKKYEKEGIELLLVSLDLKDAYANIPSFAAKHKFNSKIVYLNETNADLFCPKIDEKWSGAIPASLLINNKTGYKKFFEEQIPENKLEGEIKALIAK